ncbi:LacI family DNA-binding transcriptional regulator [Bailinhaonella thermotolerans]|uniref:LacI family transcriptional regulator n=1 Tax=Bailinhaonella thermotolerans TaxID=1070861 RepID=A0A3A4ADE6_9ACTN|nr:LacI family DNA-binding transcriptional regulator [Bailinhaonella thermotolerans]RJL23613.1 LacI family transcriptional regulator [Bailinhaonella thermotolerans]
MTDTPTRPATSVDVARLAGVSQATVSYVLNDRPGARVGEETRRRVREAAETLGYVPHASARSLRTGRSGLVLLALSVAPTGRLVAGILDDLEAAFRERGYTLVQYGERRLRGVTAARAWAELRPVAVIAETYRLTEAAVRLLRSSGVRAVVGFGEGPSPLVATSVIDHAEIGSLAAGHLHDRGRRRLAAIVPKEEGLRKMGLGRLRGAERAAEARGLTVERVDLAFDEDEAAAAVAAWRSRDPGERPDGVFAYNDDYAMLLMSALLDAGVAVPGDVALAGCDDLPQARFTRPRLTSVRVESPPPDAGLVAAVDAAIRQERPLNPGEVLSRVQCALIARDSS